MKRYIVTQIIVGLLILFPCMQSRKHSRSDPARHGNGVQSSVETEVKKPSPQRRTDSSIQHFKKPDGGAESCWVGLNAKWLFHTMGKLDAKYADVRKDYQKAAEFNKFDKNLLDEMLKVQGESQRDIHYSLMNRKRIARGTNLGGRCMIRLDDSVLFFHRMKLRNSTIFRIDYLHSDLENMTVRARLSLHDLHLAGSYERALTDPTNPSDLFYRPTFGELDILLKNVRYKVEGRYRLLKDQLVVELMISDVLVSEILIMYKRNATCGETVQKLELPHVDKLLRTLKTKLNLWMRNYLNDYLRYFGLAGLSASNEFQEYDRLKAGTLNRFVDQGIEVLKKRMSKLKATCLKVPGFTIYTINGMQIKLKNGMLRGLDTMHRRSVATGRMEGAIRYVDAIVGFGKLRLVYQYDALVNLGTPPVTGLLVLSSDHLTAKLSMSIVRNPETAEVFIDSFVQLTPETLTVEGPLIRLIANFKPLVENHVMTLMYNTLIHHVQLLGQLTKCDPSLPGRCEDEDDEDIDTPNDPIVPGVPGDSGKVHIPYIPESDLEKAYIGLARADSVEFEVPSDNENHRQKMHLRYNERLAILEVTPTSVERNDKDAKVTKITKTTTTAEPGTRKKATEAILQATEQTKSPDNTSNKKGDYDIRLSREDTVEVDLPDDTGKLVPKKIRYWEGAALGDNPLGPKSKSKGKSEKDTTDPKYETLAQESFELEVTKITKTTTTSELDKKTTELILQATERTKSPDSTNNKKSDYDIRLSREDTVEVDLPDDTGKLVPKKIRYWEGAALGDNPLGAKSKGQVYGGKSEMDTTDPNYEILLGQESLDLAAKHEIPIIGGKSEKDASDPKYKILAQKSLEKYLKTTGETQPHKVIEVKRVTMQLVSGTSTAIDFTVAPSISLSDTFNCHSNIWEEPWINRKEITVNCDRDDIKSRQKRQIAGGAKEDPSDPKH